MAAIGWDELDVLVVSGDAYVDSHSFAAAILGRWLVAHGFKTGIVAQPSWETTDDIMRMGRPRLMAAVSPGALDSMLAHYTAFRKKRGEDAYSPGGKIGLRPNRASLVYTGLVRQAFPGLPVALGGIEASLRRASHYDFWSDSLRHSVLLDSKADVVLYGMGENSLLELVQLLHASPARQRPVDTITRARIRGSVYAVHPDAIPAGAEELPSHEAILADAGLLMKATLAFERQMLQGGPCLVQRSGGRAVVFEPPAKLLTEKEMDVLYDLPFTRRAHPSYQEPIPAVAMLEGSVTSHRGCGGGCSFCSLALHQGRRVQSRSAESIFREIKKLTERPEWNGSITDIGGPSANMWQASCAVDGKNCKRESCLYPKRCRHFRTNQEKQVDMLHHVVGMDGVKHLRVASGVRHDLAVESEAYMQALVGEFTGGQLKIAPEHISEKTLRLMRKTPLKLWNQFLRDFNRISQECGKEQYVIPYLMSAFPGCTDADMEELAAWLKVRGWRPQQVQCFIPTPGTVATAMFYAKQDVDGLPIFVARTDGERLFQHRILVPDAEPSPQRTEGAGDARRQGGFSRSGPRGRDGARGERGFRSGGPKKEYGDDRKRDFKRPSSGGFRSDGPKKDFGDDRKRDFKRPSSGGFRSDGPKKEYGDDRKRDFKRSSPGGFRSDGPKKDFGDDRKRDFKRPSSGGFRSDGPKKDFGDDRKRDFKRPSSGGFRSDGPKKDFSDDRKRDFKRPSSGGFKSGGPKKDFGADRKPGFRSASAGGPVGGPKRPGGFRDKPKSGFKPGGKPGGKPGFKSGGNRPGRPGQGRPGGGGGKKP